MRKEILKEQIDSTEYLYALAVVLSLVELGDLLNVIILVASFFFIFLSFEEKGIKRGELLDWISKILLFLSLVLFIFLSEQDFKKDVPFYIVLAMSYFLKEGSILRLWVSTEWKINRNKVILYFVFMLFVIYASWRVSL